MIPELGLFCLIIAFCLSILQIVSFVSPLRQTNIMRPVAMGQTFFVTLAFIILVYAFISDDFTVQYVAHNSNSSLPLYYKFTAVWGAHEGSLLLWILILNSWSLAVAITTWSYRKEFINAILAVFATVNFGFLNILLWNSNPFSRSFVNVPLDGMDLNPLLQDFGMIIHPPILYAGYVGCTVAFAFAIAALINGKLDKDWARMLQPWVLASWMFLTLGIALGSWWAYYELGWGGWWFWDPVENASFMPWLTATALVHCLAVAKKNGQFLWLALFLAIITFMLSLLGTFLVRSGAIISVHAFVSDPQRGFVILQFLAFIAAATILLYVLRAPKIKSVAIVTPLQNRDTMIFANIILLLVATGTVLLGTFFPLLYDVVYKTQIAVGYPYFNAVFVPICIILFAVMLHGLIMPRRTLILILSISLICALVYLYLWFGSIKIGACIGLTLALAIIVSCLRTRNVSMAAAHFGLAVTIIGISLSPAYEIEKDLRLSIDENVQISNYDIYFHRMSNVEGANYISYVADFIVRKNNKIINVLHPEKRMYLSRETTMTETAIMAGLLQDVYIALGQELNENVWSVRIYYKPFVRWIWLGAVIMACGAAYAIARNSVKRNMTWLKMAQDQYTLGKLKLKLSSRYKLR